MPSDDTRKSCCDVSFLAEKPDFLVVTQIGTAYVDIYACASNVTPTGGPLIEWIQQITLTVDDVPAAGTHTYAMHFHGVVGSNSGGTVSLHVETNNMTLKVREYKK
jgi:hypothetical protein